MPWSSYAPPPRELRVGIQGDEGREARGGEGGEAGADAGEGDEAGAGADGGVQWHGVWGETGNPCAFTTLTGTTSAPPCRTSTQRRI